MNRDKEVLEIYHLDIDKDEMHYTHGDVLLLAQTDEAHQTLSGPATKKLFERAYQVKG